MADGPPAPIRFTGKAITWLVVRFPPSWTLLRGPTRRFFDRIAPDWHTRIGDPERMAPLDEALARIASVPTRVLDLGTGTGAAALHLARRFEDAEVVGVDVSTEMIALARRDSPSGRPRFEVADASALPFADREFDLVVQVSMPAFFSETARVIAAGGHLIVVSSRGPATPFHTPVSLLRRGFEREGLEWVGDGAAGPGTYYLFRRT